MAIWDDVITERDRAVFKKSGLAQVNIGFGKKPALVIIDVNYNFVGDKPEPILKSVERFPYSCGEEGWVAIHHIASLLRQARGKNIPIFYTTMDVGLKPDGWLSMKSARRKESHNQETNRIVDEIAPAESDIVIYKSRPSIFFGTSLLSMLNAMQIDTLIICGTTTSGCVRASVVDAFSYSYRVIVIEECTFDRGELSHKINLFDMNAKYADVLSMLEVENYLKVL